MTLTCFSGAYFRALNTHCKIPFRASARKTMSSAGTQSGLKGAPSRDYPTRSRSDVVEGALIYYLSQLGWGVQVEVLNTPGWRLITKHTVIERQTVS
jgi:hypothetical protein